MENKVCVHYEALTVIFYDMTATRSNARASTQRVAEGRSVGGDPFGSVSHDFVAEDDDDQMVTPTSHTRNGRQRRSVRPRRGTESSFDTAMYSWMSYVHDSDSHEEELDDLPDDIDSDLELVVGAKGQQGSYICRKGYLAQNVMLACDFDLKYTFVLAGWEGSANDADIFNQTISDPKYNFLFPAPSTFYVVDSGYANIPGFMTPYLGERYHLPKLLGSNQLPDNACELFNRRHATVRNVIERSFGLLKGKFSIIKGLMPNYTVHSQTDKVIVCCVLHNFIQMHEPLENMPPEFRNAEYVRRHDPRDRTFPFMSNDRNANPNVGEHCVLRDTIAQAMWANRR
ncbi:Unknown protein [Striga hermonthica]|uniref:DDE Tnp4 domain-containing protein n=1 Tax=Striga hermonthica TaxID=68872 RepID=A0A9N7MX49_STRHE|nr:Unknown protein [Striga hermonthica]